MTFFEKDKDKGIILVDNIVCILLKDIFRQFILQMIRITDSSRIFKDKDKDMKFWAIWEVNAWSNIDFWIYSTKLCFSQTYFILFTTIEPFDIYFSHLNGVFTLPWYFFSLKVQHFAINCPLFLWFVHTKYLW